MPEHLQLPLNRKGVISAEIFKVEGQLRVGFFIVNEWPCKLHHKCRIVDCGVFLILIFRNSEDDALSIVYCRKNGGYGLIATDDAE